jgi:3-isopropylmalate dehydratase small subunit
MNLPQEITGRVWRLGDHVNTDLLHPPEYFSLNSQRLQAGIAAGMQRLGKDAPTPGAPLVIVAGENVGCGSSRESSVRALAAVGVRAVVAHSFARIFFRNLYNRAIVPLVAPGVQLRVRSGDTIAVHPRQARIVFADGTQSATQPLDAHVIRVLDSGGLIGCLQQDIAALRDESGG